VELRAPNSTYLKKLSLKNSDIGLIPIDWNVVKLGVHARFKTGPFGSALHKKDYVFGGVPVINPMQILEGRIVPTSSMAISEAVAHRLADFRMSSGDIVIGRRGDMGRCAVVMPNQHQWLCGTGSMIVRVFSTMNAQFVQRILSSPAFVSAIENAAVGTTMTNLNQSTLGNLQIPLPPTVAEQEAIANALSDADALIESLEQLLTKKRQIKQGAMQELLTGKRRLPGFDGKWHSTQLCALADVRSGGTPSTLNSSYWTGEIAWCTPTDITALKGDKYLIRTEKTISEEGLKSSSAEFIPPNSVLMTSRATIGECAINRNITTTNQGFKNFVPYPSVDVEFLYYLLMTQTNGLLALCSGSTFLEISKTTIQTYRVLVPSDPLEREAIGSVLKAMDSEILNLKIKLTKARQIKQGMMQELLTGRIRLV
jgi:type I restriction enzyme, S subunit